MRETPTGHLAKTIDAPLRSPWLIATLIAMIGMMLTLAGMSWIENRALDNTRMRFERYNAKIQS